MKFQPKSEEEIKSMGLIDEGTYPFEVLEAKESKSKSGNDMIEMKLKIWDHQGRERICFDYLLEAMAYKLRHFCEAANILDKYEAGQLTALDCVGKQGYLELTIQAGKQKPDGGYYPDKNSVKDYLKEKPSAESGAPVDDFEQDSIPF